MVLHKKSRKKLKTRNFQNGKDTAIKARKLVVEDDDIISTHRKLGGIVSIKHFFR